MRRLPGIPARLQRRRAATGAVRVRPARDVLSAVQDGRCVLLDLRAEQYLSLDEVGTSVWQGIEEGASTTELVSRLAGEYDAPADVLTSDVQRFVDELVRLRLVVPA